MEKAEPPAAPKSNPQPPTAEQAARIVAESWRDPDWGALVWTAMTTGARRGELCAIRLSLLDLSEGRETLWLRKAISRVPGAGWAEGDLKTHQQRRIALDAETAAVLREHVDRCRQRCAALGSDLTPDALLFSGAWDGSAFLTPDSVTQRYDRMAARLGVETTFHKLRHYSATELIMAGVNPRTVAGRLGHGGGGTTTLKTYTAWVSEADQRAATGIGASMPHRPAALDPETQRRAAPRYPYEVIAAELAQRVETGSLAPEHAVPAAAELAAEHGVSLATAKRALTLAQEWGFLERVDRNTLRVVQPAPSESDQPIAPPPVSEAPSSGRALLTFTLRRGNERLTRFTSVADLSDGAGLERALRAAVVRSGGSADRVAEYEMDIERPGDAVPMMTLVVSSPR